MKHFTLYKMPTQVTLPSGTELREVHVKKGEVRRHLEKSQHAIEPCCRTKIFASFIVIFVVAIAFFIYCTWFGNQDQNNSLLLANLFGLSEYWSVVIFLVIGAAILALLFFYNYYRYLNNFYGNEWCRNLPIIFLIVNLILIAFWIVFFFNLFSIGAIVVTFLLILTALIQVWVNGRMDIPLALYIIILIIMLILLVNYNTKYPNA